MRAFPEWPAMSCMEWLPALGIQAITGVTFDAENDRPGLGSLLSHFEAARGRFFEIEGFVGRKATCGPPQELAVLGSTSAAMPFITYFPP